jgi:hypothetical protein
VLTRSCIAPDTFVGDLRNLSPDYNIIRKRVFHTCSRTPRSPEMQQMAVSLLGARGEETKGVYKYEGSAAQMILKNRITRHESRSPSPKTAGPSVPAENLGDVLLLESSMRGPWTNERILKFIENQTKNILLYCVSVLCSGGTGRIPEMMGSVFESQTARQRTPNCADLWLRPRISSSRVSTVSQPGHVRPRR